MAIQASAEDYLERIFNLQKKHGYVRSIDIAHDMGYSKPSISRAMKNLKESECITIDENGRIHLTKKGYDIAYSINERHEILTKVLLQMGVTQETAQEDACKLEHVLSEESYNAIKKLLDK